MLICMTEVLDDSVLFLYSARAWKENKHFEITYLVFKKKFPVFKTFLKNNCCFVCLFVILYFTF